mmetsp:Transcript_20136/g.50396  ORF Transcript_20136/g.50396 Transcript_20136/m.50396 type:complete len:273 (+) Transcript_20136:137-955(+)
MQRTMTSSTRYKHASLHPPDGSASHTGNTSSRSAAAACARLARGAPWCARTSYSRSTAAAAGLMSTSRSASSPSAAPKLRPPAPSPRGPAPSPPPLGPGAPTRPPRPSPLKPTPPLCWSSSKGENPNNTEDVTLLTLRTTCVTASTYSSSSPLPRRLAAACNAAHSGGLPCHSNLFHGDLCPCTPCWRSQCDTPHTSHVASAPCVSRMVWLVRVYRTSAHGSAKSCSPRRTAAMDADAAAEDGYKAHSRIMSTRPSRQRVRSPTWVLSSIHS